MAGAETGAAIGAAIPGLGETGISELAGGFIGAIIGSISAAKAQRAALAKLAPGVEEQQAVNAEAHPIASAIGDIASSLPAFRFSPGTTVDGVVAAWKAARGLPLGRTVEEIAKAKSAMLALGAQAGMGTAGAVVTPLIQGETPTLKDVGLSTLTALMFGHSRLRDETGNLRPQISQAFQRLGLNPSEPAVKPAGDETAASPPGAATAPPAPAASPATVNESPGTAYGIPQEVQDRLSAVAQKESQVGTANLAPEDWQTIQNATVKDQGHPDYHKDADVFYQQQLAKANQGRDASVAAQMAAADVVPQEPPTIDQGAAKSVVAAMPDEQLQAEYSNFLKTSRAMIAAGHHQSASELGTIGQFIREEMQKRGLEVQGNEAETKSSATPVSAQIATAREETNPAPTPAQSAAGNYQKGSVKFDGMDISIENPKGSTRRGYDSNGKEKWSVQMPVDYGYIKKTEGADGDNVDVSIGPNPDGAKDVYVIDQKDAKTGAFDEHKSMLGFDTPEQALAAYRASFSDGKADERIGGVTTMSREQFKEWATKGDTSKPLSSPPEPTGKSEALKAAQTVQAAQMAAKETAAPDWTKLRGNPDDLTKLTFDAESGKGGGQVKRVDEAGAGKKSAAVFEETADPNVIFTDIRAGKNRTDSRKLVAMLSPDQSHVMVSTAYETPTGKKLIRRVTSFDKDGAPAARKFDDMVAEGWHPLATIKTNEPTRGHVATYSPVEWAKMASEMRERSIKAQSDYEAGAAHIEQGKEFGLTEEAKQVALTSDEGATAGGKEGESASFDAIHGFEVEHAEAIHEALQAAKVKSTEDVFKAMTSGPVNREFGAALIDMGLMDKAKTPEEAAVFAHDAAEIIYDTYSSKGADAKGFSERLHQIVVDESDKQPAGEKPRVVPERPASPVTGAAKVAGDQSAAARTAGVKPVEAGRAGDTGKPAGSPAGKPAAGKPAAKPAGAGAEAGLGKRVFDALKSHKDVGDAIESLPPADQALLDKAIGADFEEHAMVLRDLADGKNPFTEGAKVEGDLARHIENYLKTILPRERNRDLDSGATLNPNEKYVPEQLHREAERALGKGHLRAIADLVRGTHSANGEAGERQPTRGKERYQLNKKLKPQEEAVIREYAERNGLMLDNDSFNRQWQAGGSKEGAENRVIIGDKVGPVTKSNDANLHPTWLGLIHRIGLHNSLFSSAPLDFKGFIHSDRGLEIVFEQPYVKDARGATREETKAEMARRGFEHLGGDAYYNPRTGVIVEDLHDENSLHTKNGIVIIDPQIRMAQSEDFGKGADVAKLAAMGESVSARDMDTMGLRGRLHNYQPPAERNYAAEDKATIEQFRVSPAEAAQTFRKVVVALQGLGVDVKIFQGATADLAKDCAKYDEWKNARGDIGRAISVSLADVHEPTVDNLIALLHESGHAVFARETPEMQAILHDAISQATNEALGLHNFTEKVTGAFLSESERANIAQEGRLVEATARALVERGFSPTDANGIVQRIGQAIKSLYNRVVMSIQQAMGYEVSPERALEYFQGRMKLALAGGKADSVVNFMGGPRMTMPVWDHPDGMTLVRNRDIRGTSDPLEVQVSKDLTNPTEEKEPGVAAQNIVHNVIHAAVKAFNEEGHNPSGISPDAIVARMGLPDEYAPGELPSDRIHAANEALVKAGFKPVDPNLNIPGIKNEAVQKQAAATAISSLQNVRDKWRADRRDAEAGLKSAKREMERLAEPLNKAIKDYTDLDLIAGQAKLRMQDCIIEQREAEKAVPELTGKVSALTQNLRQLDSEIKGNVLDQRYQDALNRLHKRLAGGGDIPFADMLQKVADLQLDWKQPAKQLSEQIHMIEDNDLASLKGNDHDARALMATAITFAKKNDFLMNLLTARRSEALEERAQLNKALQAAITGGDSARAQASFMASKLRTLLPLAKKLLKNVDDMKARQHELIDEQQRHRQFINFHNLADPIIKQTMRPLESKIGALNTDVNIGPETKNVPVPQSPNQRPEQFTRKSLFLTGKDGEITMQNEVREDLKKMGDWLDANRANREALGADYNEVEAFREKLSNHLAYYGLATPIKQLWISRWLAPTAEKLRLVNTPLSRSAAYMIENANALYRKLRNDEQKHSKEWEVRRDAAMKVLGIRNHDNFKQSVTDVFKDYVSKHKDIRSAHATNEGATEASIKAGMEHLRSDPATAELLRDPKASKTVEDFFRKTIEVNAWMAANGKSMGNKVLDPAIKMYRDVIGSEAYEFARGVSDRAEQMFLGMKAWGAPMKRISELHAAGDDEGLKEVLQPRFTKEVWNGFVKWVTHKEGASPFSGPVRADGTYDYASRDNVIKAYKNADGNPVAFAQDLFTLEGGHEQGANISDFVADTMHSLDSQYKLLAAMRGDYHEMNGRGLPTPSRHIMDARLTDAAPREFYDYIDSDRTKLGNLIRSQAYNSAFGRRMENFYQTIAGAEKQQRDYAQQFDNLAATFHDLTGKALRKAVLEKAKTEVDANGKPLNVAALAESHANARAVSKASSEIQGYLDQNRSRPPELNVLAQMMSGIGSLTVAGPGTAFIAHTIAFEQSIRKFGLNADGLGMMKDTATSTAAVALRGFLHSFGRQMANDADYIRRVEEAGLKNPNTMMKMMDQVKSIMVSPDYVHNVVAKGAIYASRAAQLASSRLSAFHYLARVIQVGNSVAWCKKFESVVKAGMEHFADHPEDMNDPSFKFTAKQLGVTEGRAFEYLQFAAGKYGIDLREAMEDAIRRQAGGKDEPILTDKIIQRIAQLSLDDMTMESSPTNRAAFFVNNSLGQLSNPMLGWTLQKTYDVVRSMREANGQRSLNGYKSAMLAYAAILPLAMVAALVRNKFDEDVQGKKQNVSDLTTIKTPEEAFLTALDNAARVGTFGIAGEAMNMAVNKDNTRPMTLDGRLFFLQTIENTVGSISNLAHQRNLDYATVVRPMIQSLGGNGFYQYAGIINHAFALDNDEARNMNRISVNNYLRVAGRQADLDVRTYGGMMQTSSQPTPWRASIGNMVMAAYANNPKDFMEAKKEAVARLVAYETEQNAKAKGSEKKTTLQIQQEAEKKVIQHYEDSNPLRVVFRTLPSQGDYQKMLASMDDNGKVATATAVRLFQHYGQQIGATGQLFGRGATQTAGTGTSGVKLDPTLTSMLEKFRPQQAGRL